ncbi:MAG: carbohydrate kinase family protein [Candidatus Paceibacterota bacterium]
MYDIIAIGSSVRDVFLKSGSFEAHKHEDSPTSLEQCFPLGSKIEIKDIAFASGGGGTNAAVTFARQGFSVACVGVIGEDIGGNEIIAELNREGVVTDFIHKHSQGHTAYSVILVNESGERTILSYKGEGQHFDVKHVPFEKLKSNWFYVDSLGGHYDLLEGVINHAVENNIKIGFNPGGKELEHGIDKLKPFLKHIDVYITNKEEGAELVGTEPADKAETLKRLQEVVKGIVVLTDGHDGVIVRDGDKEYVAGVPDSPVVERTGAGDAFGSGFVSEYMRSGDIKKAIQFATANASSVVTQFGSKAGILKKDDWGPWPLIEVK